MNNSILLIDDDVELSGLFKLLLTKKGYAVDIARDGLSGLQKVYATNPDIIVLDVMMPGLDGWETCNRIRAITNTPVIMLTAVSEQDEIIKGLNLGADDYLVKPILPDALIARIEAVLRRAYRENKDNENNSAKNLYNRPTISYENVVIDIDKYEVTRDGERVSLSPTEFQVLAVLARFKGRVLPHGFLINEIWGNNNPDEVQLLRLYIKQLRSKLEKDPKNPKIIQTEWSVGYRFG